MKRLLQHPAACLALGFAVAALISASVVWILPRPHTRLHYMIAGTAGTGVWLGVALAVVIAQWPTMGRRKG